MRTVAQRTAARKGSGPSLVIGENNSDKCTKVRLMNRETRRYIGASCGSWRCAKCAPVKRRQVVRRLRMGLPSPGAGRARFLTLTAAPLEAPGEAMARFSRRFEHLRRIHERETGERLAYFGVVELGARGRPHLHVVMRGGPFVHQSAWSMWATRAGFGRVVDIRAVDDGRLGAYVAKSLGRYLTKGLGGSWPSHFRRVRVSRGWAPGWVVYQPKERGLWVHVGWEPDWSARSWVDDLIEEDRRKREYEERTAASSGGTGNLAVELGGDGGGPEGGCPAAGASSRNG